MTLNKNQIAARALAAMIKADNLDLRDVSDWVLSPWREGGFRGSTGPDVWVRLRPSGATVASIFIGQPDGVFTWACDVPILDTPRAGRVATLEEAMAAADERVTRAGYSLL